jgi:K+-sensing histidine kinase KdpD
MRQVSHDLRNQLNAVELQSAFLAEIATDAEMKGEVKQLRQMVSECGSALQKLSVRLNPPAPNFTLYPAAEFVEDLKTKIGSEFPKQAGALNWQTDIRQSSVKVDPQLLQDALLELFRNAFETLAEGTSLDFNARTEGDNLVLTFHEPKAQFSLATEHWGREPLRHVNRGHYGLGLNRARTIIEGHNGKLQARYDSTGQKLVSEITVPLAGSGG